MEVRRWERLEDNFIKDVPLWRIVERNFDWGELCLVMVLKRGVIPLKRGIASQNNNGISIGKFCEGVPEEGVIRWKLYRKNEDTVGKNEKVLGETGEGGKESKRQEASHTIRLPTSRREKTKRATVEKAVESA